MFHQVRASFVPAAVGGQHILQPFPPSTHETSPAIAGVLISNWHKSIEIQLSLLIGP
jgi:hypothetical protein